MDTDDFLKTEGYKLDKFLTGEMYRTAGKDLVDIIIKVLESKEKARHWFYSKITGLNYERPYDYCRKGKQKEIETLLGRIEHGVFS